MPNHFCSAEDCPDPAGWIREALILKETPYIDSFTKKKTSEFYKFLS